MSPSTDQEVEKSKKAARLLVAAKELGITGSPLARLEYLSALTLKQELATFDELLKRFPQY